MRDVAPFVQSFWRTPYLFALLPLLLTVYPVSNANVSPTVRADSDREVPVRGESTESLRNSDELQSDTSLDDDGGHTQTENSLTQQAVGEFQCSHPSGRNLVVCIDGTANQFSEKVRD